jgi:hypothetical protein
MGNSENLEDNVQLPAVQQHPPIEIVEQGRVWLVKPYQPDAAGGEIFSTHTSKMDAIRATKSKMEADVHPCALRWDSPRSVGNLYWNPLFETLDVRYDELLGVWTIVPADGTCAIDSRQSREAACKRAKVIQREYDFRQLRAYDRSTSECETREHRFLRHNLADSGVRFDRDALHQQFESEQAQATADDDGHVQTDDPYLQPASPGQLGASIPDLTKVEFVDTAGVVHRYWTPWGDGTNAEILAVSRKYADDQEIRDTFETRLSQWQHAEDHPAVATIFESGTEPVPWVAYQAGDDTLDAVGTDLPVDQRLAAVEHICAAFDAVATAATEPVCGVSPGWVHVHSTGLNQRITVSQLGIEWAVQRAAGRYAPTPFTAPEQIGAAPTQQTAVYQIGAITYYLFCESLPIGADRDLEAAITSGDISPAEPIDDAPEQIGSVIDRALQTRPADRFDSVETFCRALRRVSG